MIPILSSDPPPCNCTTTHVCRIHVATPAKACGECDGSGARSGNITTACRCLAPRVARLEALVAKLTCMLEQHDIEALP